LLFTVKVSLKSTNRKYVWAGEQEGGWTKRASRKASWPNYEKDRALLTKTEKRERGGDHCTNDRCNSQREKEPRVHHSQQGRKGKFARLLASSASLEKGGISQKGGGGGKAIPLCKRGGKKKKTGSEALYHFNRWRKRGNSGRKSQPISLGS